jgi:hypothetical protein
VRQIHSAVNVVESAFHPGAVAASGGFRYLTRRKQRCRACLKLFPDNRCHGPEAVADHIVFQNQDQLDQLHDGGILRGPVDVVTIDDIMASNGTRNPAAGNAQPICGAYLEGTQTGDRVLST